MDGKEKNGGGGGEEDEGGPPPTAKGEEEEEEDAPPPSNRRARSVSLSSGTLRASASTAAAAITGVGKSPLSAEELESELIAAREQVLMEKAGKRKIFHSLVKVANELRRTRSISNQLLRQQHYANKNWYEGGMWRAPDLLPSVTQQQRQQTPSQTQAQQQQQQQQRKSQQQREKHGKRYSSSIIKKRRGSNGGTSPGNEGSGGVGGGGGGGVVVADATATTTATKPSASKARLREAISLSDLFFSLVTVTAFTRTGVTISQRGYISYGSFVYFAIFWNVRSKEASYGTRFDTTDLSAQMTTLVSCFAVLFASLSVQADTDTVDATRIMIMASFVATLHCLLHVRVMMHTTMTEWQGPGNNKSGVASMNHPLRNNYYNSATSMSSSASFNAASAAWAGNGAKNRVQIHAPLQQHETAATTTTTTTTTTTPSWAAMSPITTPERAVISSTASEVLAGAPALPSMTTGTTTGGNAASPALPRPIVTAGGGGTAAGGGGSVAGTVMSLGGAASTTSSTPSLTTMLQQQQQQQDGVNVAGGGGRDGDARLARHVVAYAKFNIFMNAVEAALYGAGAFVFDEDWEYRDALLAAALLSSLRVPRAFLANDFHAACSKRGVLFILLLGFLLQNIVVVAGEFFDYQTPNLGHYGFLGAACLMFFCIKLLYVDDSDTLAEDHALLVNRVAGFFFNVGQFTLLLSTTVMGSGLNLLTHDYMAATAALPGSAKNLVCGGFSAVLFSTFFIKSMHLKRVPIDRRNQSLFVTAFVVQTAVLLAVVTITALMCFGWVGSFFQALMQNDIKLLFSLSGMALFVVLMGWLDEGIELTLYGSAEESSEFRIHPFGFWWCLKPDVTEEDLDVSETGASTSVRRQTSLSALSPLLGSSIANMKDMIGGYDAVSQREPPV